jgi:hypothetical protein
LPGIVTGGANLRRQRRELVAAPLAHGREWLRVLHELERHFVRPANPVQARNGLNTEQRTIYAK